MILIFPWEKWELFRYFPIPIFHTTPGWKSEGWTTKIGVLPKRTQTVLVTVLMKLMKEKIVQKKKWPYMGIMASCFVINHQEFSIEESWELRLKRAARQWAFSLSQEINFCFSGKTCIDAFLFAAISWDERVEALWTPALRPCSVLEWWTQSPVVLVEGPFSTSTTGISFGFLLRVPACRHLPAWLLSARTSGVGQGNQGPNSHFSPENICPSKNAWFWTEGSQGPNPCILQS